MSEEGSKHEIQPPENADENKAKTAFIQVPYELKEQVQVYMEQLCFEAGADFKVSNDNIESLPTHGCFLVISLDKIEAVIKGLKSCLTMAPGNDARNIKSEINRVLAMLS
jgi:hypothetical protein